MLNLTVEALNDVFLNLAMFNFGELARIFYCTRLVLGFYFDYIKMATKLPILR